MRDLLERVISAVLGVAAVAMAMALIHQEFFPSKVPGQRRPSEYVANWRTMLPASRLIGSADARVTIVEFTDLQCPFCRRFNKALATVRERYPSQTATAFVHFPLAGHDQARPAARAAECASAAGRFSEAIDFLFEMQDSLGKKPWSWFAKGSGVKDTTQFARCMADTTAVVKIAAGLASGKQADVKATPTILVNGWRFGGVPSDTELVRAVGDIIAGRKPYKGFPSSGLPGK
jgi:NhaA family Na+:H+ antiporter